MKPALGIIWHHCVTTRFTLSMNNLYNQMETIDNNNNNNNNSNIERKLMLTKSPILPSFISKFEIFEEGIKLVH